MDKRYQVFLSSTYEDLKEERLEVMKAILELDCIPCGMEYFPAASEDQWTYIKELIEQCDYYVVVVAGRYGSTDPNGISYTQKEYEYAISQNVPTISFLHSDPGSIPSKLSEETKEGKKKLKDFQNQIRTRLCKEWGSVHELGAVVSRSLTQLIKRNPRPGWVRSDGLASSEASEEILKLKRKVEEQEKELENIRLKAPSGSEQLSQGNDKYEIQCKINVTQMSEKQGYPKKYNKFEKSFVHTWDDIFSSFGPYLLVDYNESHIKSGINKMLKLNHETFLMAKFPEHRITSFTITEDCLQTIKVQFNALGLIDVRMQQIGDYLVKMCKLTPLGERHLVNIRAIKKSKKKSK